ncbi:MAG: sulfurtransferase FdhD [Sneathiella sp.]|uniref:formate dehydrogenase accessory sulfurtransferase FdhD n=1 Tax=Sneathiella sp. TaxID=1964365 RepID=UPI000C5422C7|nr:formate dehydrogenase accessory sulfurtransferase FdhD [Sneathiella sp.]MAL77800.1 sulfurtransferase FdhD [Sneathiella sp.]
MAAQSTAEVQGLAIREGGRRDISRILPEEKPVALVFNGTTAAVMMATPDDLEDFAVGFALTEGFIETPDQIETLEIIPHAQGLEARFFLNADRLDFVHERRRNMLGPLGCGLCGIDSLEQALRPLPRLEGIGPAFSQNDIARATDSLRQFQPLHDLTHALHAAGFLLPGRGIVMAREDVGRHNALDKLIGALARQGMEAGSGAILLTSRISVDMVQKTVISGCPVLIAASAPTAHALDLAKKAVLTLAAFARDGQFEIYSHPGRILTGTADAR